MISLNMRTKSALLMFALLTIPVSNVLSTSFMTPVKNLLSSVTSNKVVLSAVVCSLIAMKIRLDTKPSCDYKWNDFSDDVKDILKSHNIFSSDLYKKILSLFDKYCIGLPVKIEDKSTKIKKEDGSVLSIKGKVLLQKPFGLFGFFDSYILGQMKKISELVPVIASFYVLVRDPQESFAAKK